MPENRGEKVSSAIVLFTFRNKAKDLWDTMQHYWFSSKHNK